MYECVANEVKIGLHIAEGSRGVIFLDDEKQEHHDIATFEMPQGANNYFHDSSQFLPFSLPLHHGIVERGIPDATTKYYKQCSDANCIPLTFFHVPHVLIRGQIDVTGLRKVHWCCELHGDEYL